MRNGNRRNGNRIKWAVSAASVLAFPSLCAAQTSAAGAVTAGGATGAAGQASPSNSEGQLGDIVVTARRASESLQRTPVAVTVLNQQAFDKAGAFDTTQLTQFVPGLRVTTSVGDRNNVIFNIRGQGVAYGTVFGAVIPYFADVPITQNFTNGNFFDLENVQVLRGPQGTLFGRVTDGGNILIEPQRPTNKYEGYAELRLGDYNLRGGTAAVNIPIIPGKILLRLAADIARRDGFTRNAYNSQYIDDQNYETGRIGLTIRPTESFESYTVYQYQHTDTNGTSTELSLVNPTAVLASTAILASPLAALYPDLLGPGVPLTQANFLSALETSLARQRALGPRQTDIVAPLFDRRTNQYLINQTSLRINETLTVKNVFGYLRIREYEAEQFNGSPEPYVQIDSSIVPLVSQKQLSEELRLQGMALGSRLNYTIGGYYDSQRPLGRSQTDSVDLTIIQRGQYGQARTSSTAGFAQGEYDLSAVMPGLKINGGIRYTRSVDKTRSAAYLALLPTPLLPAALNPQLPEGVCTTFASPLGSVTCKEAEQKSHALTYAAGFSYQISPSKFAYFKVSRGYRPGGVNGFDTPFYAPEYDRSFEVGAKADFRLSNSVKARADIALYHDDYSDIQKLVTTAGAGGIPTAHVANVASATIQGIEFEGTLLLSRGLELGVNYSYTDAHFDNADNTPRSVLYGDGSLTPTVPNSGACSPAAFVTLGFCYLNRFAQTPKHQLTVDAHYTWHFDTSASAFSFGGSLYKQSSMALQDTSALNPDIIEPGYTVLNLDANWHQPFGAPIDVGLFMTNVANKIYRIGTDSLSNNASLGIAANIYAPPRMGGFTLRYHIQ